MRDFPDDPVFARECWTFVVEMELRFADAQHKAEVELMGVCDPAASLVFKRQKISRWFGEGLFL
jgi:hypothetical protein